jgi:hypothetical protein
VQCRVYKCTCIGKMKHPAFPESSFCVEHAAAAYADMLFHCCADFCKEILPCSTRTHRHFKGVLRYCGVHLPLAWPDNQCGYHPHRPKAAGKSICEQCLLDHRVPIHLIK